MPFNYVNKHESGGAALIERPIAKLGAQHQSTVKSACGDILRSRSSHITLLPQETHQSVFKSVVSGDH